MKCITAITFLFFSLYSAAKPVPAIQLATKYNLKYDISHYWISEKLDGVRGYWNGSELLTKNGNTLHAPKWFTANWPIYPIDGELWIGRHKFEQTLSCVKQRNANKCWKKIRFMIFDLPQNKAIFTQRINKIKTSVQTVGSPYFQAISQFKVSSITQLNQKLDDIVKHKGEGLMLHYQNALYTVGRNSNIMKLKPYQDAEAVVLKHIAGKGKYQGMLGSIQVKTFDGITFKIGSGFSDNDRVKPPPIGSVITFKHIGKTQRGVPKFASFLRIREQEK